MGHLVKLTAIFLFGPYSGAMVGGTQSKDVFTASALKELREVGQESGSEIAHLLGA